MLQTYSIYYFITTLLYEGWKTVRKQCYSRLPVLFPFLYLCHPFFHFAYSLKCAPILGEKKIIILRPHPLFATVAVFRLSLQQGSGRASQGRGVCNTLLLTEQAGQLRVVPELQAETCPLCVLCGSSHPPLGPFTTFPSPRRLCSRHTDFFAVLGTRRANSAFEPNSRPLLFPLPWTLFFLTFPLLAPASPSALCCKGSSPGRPSLTTSVKQHPFPLSPSLPSHAWSCTSSWYSRSADLLSIFLLCLMSLCWDAYLPKAGLYLLYSMERYGAHSRCSVIVGE